MLHTNVMDLLNFTSKKWQLLGVAFLTFWTQILGAPVDCEHGLYFDKITGKCDPCEDICHRAIQQGTVAKCSKLCPDFTVTTTPPRTRACPLYFYYDLSVDRCEPCKTLCAEASSRGQEGECQKKCPDWPTNEQSTQKLNPEVTTSQSVLHEKVDGIETIGTLPIWALIVIGVLLCVCAVLMFWFRREIMYSIKNLCLCSLHRRPRRSEVVTDQSSYRYEPAGLGPFQSPIPLETRV